MSKTLRSFSSLLLFFAAFALPVATASAQTPNTYRLETKSSGQNEIHLDNEADVTIKKIYRWNYATESWDEFTPERICPNNPAKDMVIELGFKTTGIDGQPDKYKIEWKSTGGEISGSEFKTDKHTC